MPTSNTPPAAVAAWLAALAAAGGDAALARQWFVELVAVVVFDRPPAARTSLNITHPGDITPPL